LGCLSTALSSACLSKIRASTELAHDPNLQQKPRRAQEAESRTGLASVAGCDRAEAERGEKRRDDTRLAGRWRRATLLHPAKQTDRRGRGRGRRISAPPQHPSLQGLGSAVVTNAALSSTRHQTAAATLPDAEEPKLFHLAVQGRTMNPQPGRGRGEVALRVGQRAVDHLPLRVAQRAVRWGSR